MGWRVGWKLESLLARNVKNPNLLICSWEKYIYFYLVFFFKYISTILTEVVFLKCFKADIWIKLCLIHLKNYFGSKFQLNYIAYLCSYTWWNTLQHTQQLRDYLVCYFIRCLLKKKKKCDIYKGTCYIKYVSVSCIF